MAKSDQVIIIKRIKKGGHGHHGGAWKVAYADFVTAMMAFFLLLWLLNVTTDVQRKGIADYFAPASISQSKSGAGGVFGGQSITSPGARINDTSSGDLSKDVPEPDESDNDRKEDPGSGKPTGPEKNETENVTTGDKVVVSELKKEVLPTEPEAQTDNKAFEDAKKKEEDAFKRAEEALRQAIQSSPEMAMLEKNLIIDSTPEGLRIQIVDRDGYSLFSSGNTNLADKSRELVTLVGKVISRLPNQITISGHTDNTPYRGLTRSNNWELSSGRAYSSMMAMMNGGVTEDKVTAILGKADREPLMKDDPKNQQNRRISIVLLRRYGNEAKDATPAPIEAPKTETPAVAQ
jgi:chemotaxis protein MotB